MPIETNAQRITRIYRGSTKVWEDTMGQWQQIQLDSDVDGGTAEYAIVGNQLVFKPQIIDPFKFINNYEQVPSRTLCTFDNLKIASVREDTIGIDNTTGGSWSIYPQLTGDDTIILATRSESNNQTDGSHFYINLGGIAVTIKK